MPPKKSSTAAGKDKDGAGGGGAATTGKRVSDEDAEPVILEYLIRQNRPYNATDLQANLKSKHNIGKTAVTKALASLAAKGDIVEKEYGKQKIYGPKQSEQAIDASELATLKEEIAAPRAKTMELSTEHKEITAEIAVLESAPATAELPEQIAGLEEEVSKSGAHLASLKNDPNMLLSKADIVAIDNAYNSARKTWLTYRKAGIEICGMITDGMDLSKEAAKEWLIEEQGIEMDDAHLDALAKPALMKPMAKRKA